MSIADAKRSGDDAGMRQMKADLRDLETRLTAAKAALGGLQGLIDSQTQIVDSQARLEATAEVVELEVSFAATFSGFHASVVEIDKPAWASKALLIGGIQVASNGMSLPVDSGRVVDLIARDTASTAAPGDLEILSRMEIWVGYTVPYQRMFSLPTDASIWFRPYIRNDGSGGSGTCRIKISAFVYWGT